MRETIPVTGYERRCCRRNHPGKVISGYMFNRHVTVIIQCDGELSVRDVVICMYTYQNILIILIDEPVQKFIFVSVFL